MLQRRLSIVDPAGRDRDPRRRRQRAHALLTEVAEQLAELGLSDQRGHLRGERHQKRFFAFVKLTMFALLHYQHAKQLAARNDRHAEEGAETFLFNRRNEFEAGMTLRVGEVDRFRQSPYQPDDALIECQRDDLAARLFQPARRHEVIATTIVIGEINRADFGFHGETDFVHQDLQRLIQTRRGRHFLYNLTQLSQHHQRGLTSFSSISRRIALRCTLLQRHDDAGKLFHYAAVNIALKRDHLTNRIPKADPAPAVKFRRAAGLHVDIGVIAHQLQKKPLLFLADTYRLRVPTHQTFWQLIT